MSAYSDPPVLRRGPGEENMLERRALLRRVSEARGRAVLGLACGEGRPAEGVLPGLEAEDLPNLIDRLRTLGGCPLDLVVDLPGSAPEVLEEVVRLVREAVPSVAVLVPRTLGPPGLLLGLAADELWLDASAAVAPLLPWLHLQGRIVPAHALLSGIARVRSGELPAFDAMFRGLSPADPVMAEGVTRLCRDLAGHFLRTGLLTGADPDRALTVAAALSDPELHVSPARLLGPARLAELGVPVRTIPGTLSDMLLRWSALARQAVQGTAMRLVETPEGTLTRRGPGAPQPAGPRAGNAPGPATGGGQTAKAQGGGAAQAAAAQAPKPKGTAREAGPRTSDVAVIEVKCGCGAISKIQANLASGVGLQEGHWAFPPDDQFHCPECMSKTDLAGVRQQIESQAGRKIIG